MFNSKAIKIYSIVITIHTKLLNEFVLIHTHQDLLPHALFWVNYFLDKQH